MSRANGEDMAHMPLAVVAAIPSDSDCLGAGARSNLLKPRGWNLLSFRLRE